LIHGLQGERGLFQRTRRISHAFSVYDPLWEFFSDYKRQDSGQKKDDFFGPEKTTELMNELFSHVFSGSSSTKKNIQTSRT